MVKSNQYMVYTSGGHMRRYLTALVVMALVIAGCGDDDDGSVSGGSPTDTAGETLTVAVPAEPTTLDPHIAKETGLLAVISSVYEPLYRIDAEGELVPVLASGEAVMKDDTTWEIPVREGVEFHNGEALDASVVADSINRIIDPATESRISEVSPITGATATGDFTVEVTTEEFDRFLPRRLTTTLWIVPSEHSATPEFATQPIGTGPYTFDSYTAGESAILQGNPDYWGDPPEFDTVEIRFITEAVTRASALEAGEVQIALDLPPELADGVTTVSPPIGIEAVIVRMDMTEGPTTDVRVRQALNYAVDKEALATTTMGSADPLNCQPVPPGSFGYNGDLEPYPHDPERARDLIEEAGAAGQTVTLEVPTGHFAKEREVGEILAQAWTDVGLEVDLQVLDFDSWLTKVYDDRGGGLTIIASGDSLRTADKQTSQHYHSDGPVSLADLPQLDAIIDSARSAEEESESAELYQQALELGCEEAVQVWLTDVRAAHGIAEGLTWEPAPEPGHLYFNEVHSG